MASQSSISRFYDRVVVETILTLQVFNQALIDKARLVRNDTNMVIDLDSTHSDTFGHQEQTAYNAHYGTNGYHTLVAFDGITGDFLKAKLRSVTNIFLKGAKNFLNRYWNIITKRFQPLIFSFVETVVSRHRMFRIYATYTKISMSFG